MAKSNPIENSDVIEPAASSTTQRAYTLRLRGTDKDDHSWRNALWATHEAVNKGAKVFGDWLLTLRGGLDHTLADEPLFDPQSSDGRKRIADALKKLKKAKKKDADDPTEQDAVAAIERQRRDRIRDRHILLALSWLSVEDEQGAPKGPQLIVAYGDHCQTAQDSQDGRDRKVIDALRTILTARINGDTEIDSWMKDCEGSLKVRIRDDAVWVNRSAAFDAARQRCGESFTRDNVWDMLEPFFGSREAYLTPLTSETETDEDAAPAEDKAKDLVQKAGQWLSSRFGEGKGANFERMAQVYEAVSAWAKGQSMFPSGSAALGSLATSLAPFDPPSTDAEGILKLISGPGYKSATRNIITTWGTSTTTIANDALVKFAETAAEDVVKCKGNTGGKGRRPYSDAILSEAERACGFTYLQTDGAARHFEFAVMLDHAARRVSIGHSWIKRAEAERQKFKADALKLDAVPAVAKAKLDAFCGERSKDSGALDAYRIRKRAVGGWKEIVARWSRADCKTAEDRIAAAREAQADPEIDKFGDIQLFEALAADDAFCVWRVNEKADAQPLLDYAAGTDALAKQKRFKVPAYRHPDPLSHPVFCDFGNSRWDIRFAVHDARSQLDGAKNTVARREKEVQKAQQRFDKARTPEKQAEAQNKLAKAQDDLREAREAVVWLSNQHALSMGLWNGGAIDAREPLRWSCKRLSDDLGLRQASNSSTIAVTRGDRLGRAAAGATADSNVAILSVFNEDHWNGRLQAPREQLDAIAAHVKKHGWDEKARKLRDRIRWLVSFSAKLQPAGPWLTFADKWEKECGPHFPLHPKRAENEKLKSRTRLLGWEWSKPDKDYIVEFGSHSKPDSRGVSFPFSNPTDLGERSGQAKLILSRLPGLRLLSVDLGHRYAAACAVWEAISSEAMREACREHEHAEPRESDLFIHLKRTVQKEIKKGRDKGKMESVDETTIYRRIAADVLPDGKPHPAPWARLDRQFLIKLPGEDQPARAASNKGDFNEVGMVASLAATLGLVADEERDSRAGRAVDELMSKAVRVLTLALKRHARRAKIAYALDPATKTIPGMGGSEKAFTIGDEDHVKLLVNALFDWHALAGESKWDDKAARDLWNQHIAAIDGQWHVADPTSETRLTEEEITRPQRKKDDQQRREQLKPIAQHLANADRSAMHAAWTERWEKDDGEFAEVPKVESNTKGPAQTKPTRKADGFHAHLRLVTDWIMPRGLRQFKTISMDKFKRLKEKDQRAWADRWHVNIDQDADTVVEQIKAAIAHHNLLARPKAAAAKNVGGLSLTRIATMKSLYQLHKAFYGRPRPNDLLYGKKRLEADAGSGRRVCNSILQAMEKMREQRVKQLASRIVEAALGVGRIKAEVIEAGKKRPQQRVDDACHAVVIENLTNYRPDELQTRRENKALMTWSSSKVKKYLTEACQLHGLHLREVMANYTSQQDSRTGLPGVRCEDVWVDKKTGEIQAYWWKKAHAGALKKVNEKKTDAEAHFIVALDAHLKKMAEGGKPLPATVRVMRKGGDLFVTAPPPSCRADGHRPCPLCDGRRALQADLNAAANIGLRALLDPDFPGKWWYVPCIEDKSAATALPKADRVKGSTCFGPDPAKPEQFGSLRKIKTNTSEDQAGSSMSKKGKKSQRGEAKGDGKETTNYWCDPTTGSLRPAVNNGFWLPTPAYWKWVRKRVVASLSAFADLEAKSDASDLALEYEE